MSKNIIWIILLIIVLIGFIFFLGTNKEVVEPQKIAEEWIINNSSTYNFDGQDLTFLSIEGDRIYFAFQSTSSGYGDRTGQILATVMTPHIIEIVVDSGQVISAMTDGKYDEINKKLIGTVFEDKEVSIYFLSITGEQEELIEVKRIIPHQPGISYPFAALNQLLDGPTQEESEEGIFSMINPGTILYDLILEGDVVKADFNEKLQEGVAGSATVMAIRNQIEKTLLQFDYISEVVISINGNSEEILQP